MTVIFSKKCEIGLQSVLYLSTIGKNIITDSGIIAKHLKLPKEFVSKVLQQMTFGKIVGSKKGKNGGFFLAKEPSEIRLIDIVKAIDGTKVFDCCVLGFPGCSNEEPCPVHNVWGGIREQAHKMLMDETLEDLKQKTVNKLNFLK